MKIDLWFEDGGWHASLPDYPTIMSDGERPASAVTSLRDAVEECLTDIDSGKLPTPEGWDITEEFRQFGRGKVKKEAN